MRGMRGVSINKEDLQCLCAGTIGALLINNEALSITDYESEQMRNPDNWQLEDSTENSWLIKPVTLFLMSYRLRFLQIQFNLENNTIIKVDVITDETKKIRYTSNNEV